MELLIITFDTAHSGGSQVTQAGKWKLQAIEGDVVEWRDGLRGRA